MEKVVFFLIFFLFLSCTNMEKRQDKKDGFSRTVVNHNHLAKHYSEDTVWRRVIDSLGELPNYPEYKVIWYKKDSFIEYSILSTERNKCIPKCVNRIKIQYRDKCYLISFGIEEYCKNLPKFDRHIKNLDISKIRLIDCYSDTKQILFTDDGTIYHKSIEYYNNTNNNDKQKLFDSVISRILR